MQGKSGCFASQNLRFRNAKSKFSFFFGTIFTKPKRFSSSVLEFLENSSSPRISRRIYFFFGTSSVTNHAHTYRKLCL
ncbi:hypothetical protein CTM63_11105 [Prevotella intermedia]|nr:hypothetical protein CTM63_11105 [Prevotella intermedia]